MDALPLDCPDCHGPLVANVQRAPERLRVLLACPACLRTMTVDYPRTPEADAQLTSLWAATYQQRAHEAVTTGPAWSGTPAGQRQPKRKQPLGTRHPRRKGT